MPDAILIAGANGAGKTTFARQFLRVLYPQGTFLNADEIQREDARFARPFSAGRELLRRVAVLEASGATFAIETTLSSTMYARRLRAWSRRGYRTTLHFIELPSADYAIERVARGTPCRRRISGGDSSGDSGCSRPSSIPCRTGGVIGSATTEAYGLSIKTKTEADEQELEVLLEAARRATWDALHGPTHLRSGRYHPSEVAAEVVAGTTAGRRVAAQHAAAADERRARKGRKR